MKFSHNTFRRIQPLPLLLALILVLGSLVWIQASVSPAAAQEPPAGEISMSVQLVPGDDFTTAAIGTTPVFFVGDTFKVSIVAENVEDPGIFGGQFELAFETEYLAGVADSMVPGAAMQPVVVAVNEIDNEVGKVAYAGSRQGDLDNLAGNVVLATLTFEAVGATEPPEGQTTTPSTPYPLR